MPERRKTSPHTPLNIDVSPVFVKRDSKHHDFKPEIEAKEQIRDHLNEADQATISQFARWWDTYRMSLHEQVKESDGTMWGYLKGFGYE